MESHKAKLPFCLKKIRRYNMNNDYGDGILEQFVPKVKTIILMALFLLGLNFADLSALLPKDDVKEQPVAVSPTEPVGNTGTTE